MRTTDEVERNHRERGMAKNQAATNPSHRPLLKALVDRGRASRWFNHPEGRNSLVGRGDCFPAEYCVRPTEALLSPLGGIGITYRIVGRWGVLLLERDPAIKFISHSYRKGYADTILAVFDRKRRTPSIVGILASRLELLPYTATNVISPSDFNLGKVGVGLYGSSYAAENSVFVEIMDLFPMGHLP